MALAEFRLGKAIVDTGTSDNNDVLMGAAIAIAEHFDSIESSRASTIRM